MNPYIVVALAVVAAVICLLWKKLNRIDAAAGLQRVMTAQVFLSRFLGVGIRLRLSLRPGAVRENFELIERAWSASVGGVSEGVTPDLRKLTAREFVIRYLGAHAFGHGDDVAGGGGRYAWAKYGHNMVDLVAREPGCAQQNLGALRAAYETPAAPTL